MDPLEGQFEPELKPAYFDPDAPDMSEQEFAASLEAEIEKPAFVVDDEDPAKEIPVADGLLPTPSSCGDSRPRLSDRAKLELCCLQISANAGLAARRTAEGGCPYILKFRG